MLRRSLRRYSESRQRPEPLTGQAFTRAREAPSPPHQRRALAPIHQRRGSAFPGTPRRFVGTGAETELNLKRKTLWGLWGLLWGVPACGALLPLVAHLPICQCFQSLTQINKTPQMAPVGLQNLYAPVRSRPAPPILSIVYRQAQSRPSPPLWGLLWGSFAFRPLFRPHCVMADCLSKAAICCSALNRSSCGGSRGCSDSTLLGKPEYWIHDASA